MNNHTKGRLLLPLILLTALTALLLSGCSGRPGGGSPFGKEEAKPKIDKSIAVKTDNVIRTTLDQWLPLSGDVSAKGAVSVVPDVTGKISRILVSEGTYVRKGQILAQVDPSRPGMQYTESPVKAPISGTVTALYGEIGAVAAPQQPLMEIGRLQDLEIVTQVPERFIYQIEKGNPARVSTEALPGQVFDAVISDLAPVLNPVSRTMEIALALTSGKEWIKAGMFVDIELLSSTKEDILVIPDDAVFQMNDGDFVFVIRQGRAYLREVIPGLRTKGVVEIVEGLEENEEVVIAGRNLLSDDTAVRVVNQ